MTDCFRRGADHWPETIAQPEGAQQIVGDGSPGKADEQRRNFRRNPARVHISAKVSAASRTLSGLISPGWVRTKVNGLISSRPATSANWTRTGVPPPWSGNRP